MKLSIVIPVYRVETTLDRCLKSVAGQTFGDFEVILVDDGSPDGCPERCDEWARRDNRFTVVHQQNGGLSAARNAGIDRARGEFITFIDSDDYIADGTLEALMPLAEETDLLEYPLWRFYGAADQTFVAFPQQTYDSPDDYWLGTKAYLHTYAWNKVYRRWLFDEVRFPEGKVFEDVYTLPRLLSLRPRIMTTDRGTYYYCDNAKGITATAKGEQLRMLLDAHLTAGMPVDDSYYMHLLNIQMDVCELTGDTPRLPQRSVRPCGSTRQRLKAYMLNILGINVICKLNKIVHRFRSPSRS